MPQPTSRVRPRRSLRMFHRYGACVLSTYKAFDGVPEGEYTVTVTWQEPRFDETGRPTPNKLPERYAKPESSPLKATIRSGSNTLDLDLSR